MLDPDYSLNGVGTHKLLPQYRLRFARMAHFNLQDEVQALADGAVSIENEVPARSIDGALDCGW